MNNIQLSEQDLDLLHLYSEDNTILDFIDSRDIFTCLDDIRNADKSIYSSLISKIRLQISEILDFLFLDEICEKMENVRLRVQSDLANLAKLILWLIKLYEESGASDTDFANLLNIDPDIIEVCREAFNSSSSCDSFFIYLIIVAQVEPVDDCPIFDAFSYLPVGYFMHDDELMLQLADSLPTTKLNVKKSKEILDYYDLVIHGM
ncbi:MAG TPA: hypothetical protein VEF53_10085 [Patescibacteria group bacterium]|nr:hypothetical protein [Patescibacteria group bacterium]